MVLRASSPCGWQFHDEFLSKQRKQTRQRDFLRLLNLIWSWNLLGFQKHGYRQNKLYTNTFFSGNSLWNLSYMGAGQFSGLPPPVGGSYMTNFSQNKEKQTRRRQFSALAMLGQGPEFNSQSISSWGFSSKDYHKPKFN